MDVAQKMIDERQRRLAVSLKALELMQAYYKNRYFSFKMVSADEEARWYAQAEAIVPPL